MGRTYAGILAYLAFVVVVFRGFLRGVSLEQTLELALLCLVVFALIGFLCGELGSWFVAESVQARLANRVQTEQQGNRTAGANAPR